VSGAVGGGLAGVNLLVTGANRGIGKAFVDEAVARGARVYATARRPESLVEVFAEHRDRVIPLGLDLRDSATIQAVVQRCSDLDLLVHNAGAPLPGRALDVPDAVARELFETNFFGPLQLLRGLAGGLGARRGGALVVTSQAALLLSRSSPIYSASKAALTMATLGIRAQLRDAGVRVAIVFPGMVDTEMTASMSGPKTSPRTVAANVFDAFARGETAIFPDGHSQQVRALLAHRFLDALTEPQPLAEEAIARFVAESQRVSRG
jgi:NAD(P)-dependent dehydrogenase (short-subunit alcohol dehydrogenase family)